SSPPSADRRWRAAAGWPSTIASPPRTTGTGEGGDFGRRVLPALDALLLGALPPGARLPDLCCGTGQLAGMLVARGYRVSGLDISPRMLAFALRNAPGAEFVVGDARTFRQPRVLHAALLDGGAFVFDLNAAAGYEARW